MLTSFHAKFFAHELSRQAPAEELERLSQSLFDARVDLNPHQVEAALFALQNPLQKGVVLADEVGLGKTVEAGLVLCQKWAERKRKLIVVCPAHIRKQWALELAEKFSLPSVVVDARVYRQLRKEGHVNPFDIGKIVVISYAFASRMKDELRAVAWELVVMDEAHKLRNAYQSSKKGGRAIQWAFELRRKLLLTATPLQNSLLELYGLGWMIDEHIFGDKSAFQARYCGAGGDLAGLRQRMAQFVKRTLRRDVLEYVKYTKRYALTQGFHPTADEAQLAKAVQKFLQQEHSYALPQRQRHLVAMIAHKVLASSPKALVGTLEVMKARLERLRDGLPEEQSEEDLLEKFAGDDDMTVEDLRELLDEEDGDEIPDADAPLDPRRLKAELADLESLIKQANALTIDSKAQSLKTALASGFQQMEALSKQSETKPARKALIFTESRRTQEFLAEFLEKNGYAGKVVSFNGTNTHPQAKATYEAWQKKNAGTDRLTGSKSVDIRTALVDQFRDGGEIFIATEAAAEGINLQFCSLVINYDLPWNPQRIEQRIGRCHRYGQKHDVVVVNFLNEENPADQRVQQLLQEKFHLFDGLFGASDEVLGAIESGVDFEQRILRIYQTCRTPEAITAAFDQLQQELDTQIQTRMQNARKQLLENFDADVHDKLKLRQQQAKDALDKFGRRFWSLTRFILAGKAQFDEADYSFTVAEAPAEGVPTGRYELISAATRKGADAAGHLYRLGTPLGQWTLSQGKKTPSEISTVCFNVSAHPVKISMLEPFKGSGGWLRLVRVMVESEEKEEFLVWAGIDAKGQSLDAELAQKLWELDGTISAASMPDSVQVRLEGEAKQAVEGTLLRHSASVSKRLSEAQGQLDEWAKDCIQPERQKLDDMEAQKAAARKAARTAVSMDSKMAAEQEARRLDKAIRAQEDSLKVLREKMDDKLDELFETLKHRVAAKTSSEELFTIRWEVV